MANSDLKLQSSKQTDSLLLHQYCIKIRIEETFSRIKMLETVVDQRVYNPSYD